MAATGARRAPETQCEACPTLGRVKIRSIRMLEDRTGDDRSDGFLELTCLTLQNIYEDGSESKPYACDVVSRPGSDAVVAVLYKLDGRRVSVVVREAPRAPIYLRRLVSKRLGLPRA